MNTLFDVWVTWTGSVDSLFSSDSNTLPVLLRNKRNIPHHRERGAERKRKRRRKRKRLPDFVFFVYVFG